MTPAISVRNLGKSYRIVHQTGKAYRTLRDDIADHAKRIFTGQWKRQETGEEFWALRDINFDIQPGEIVGVIGRNGAGKSTLLKTLCRITPPTAGEIIMRGRVGSLLEVGTGFHPELTGRENIFLSGAILGMKRAEVVRKFDEIVAFSEVEKFLDTPVKRYSSGMYVRLAFAVAAHLETEILLVDEVLAVGDVSFQKKCLDRMKAVGQSGRTVLFVSHNMSAIAALCEKGLVLRQGQALPMKSTSEAIDDYLANVEVPRTEWTGSAGDENLEMVRTWVGNRSGSRTLATADEIEVGVEVVIKKPIEGLILGFNLISEYGGPLAYCLYDDAESSAAPEVKPGPMRCVFRIPPHTLSQGTFNVRMDIGIHQLNRIIGSQGSLMFTVENIDGIATRFVPPHDPTHQSLFRPNWKVEVTR